MCSTTAEVSGEPAMRNALVKARRRIACCVHCGTGCNHAPRPGRLLPVSTITAYSPFPVGTATTRSRSTASSRFRHPTHVRTGPSVLLCARLVRGAESSRWITAQSKACRPTRVNRSPPPFSGVVGSRRGCSMNVSSRVNRAGFTGTRRVLVSAVSSAEYAGPSHRRASQHPPTSGRGQMKHAPLRRPASSRG